MKIVYIVSDINKSLAFEWIASHLDKKKFQLTFILLGDKDTVLASVLRSMNINYHEIIINNKLDLITAFFKILFLLSKIRAHVAHTHLFYANLLGQSAALILRVKKRIFTRHHAMVHYNEYPSGLKWDKYLNRIATHIIAISENVKSILIDRDGADQNKIRLIYHGFDLGYFNDWKDKSTNGLRKKYNIPSDALVLGVISRYLEWKGLQYIIPAFERVRQSIPHAHLILANARGPYLSNVRSLLQLLPKDSYTEIEFENDLASLYRLFNVFIHTPIDAASESFGQTYIEALACGIPSVFSLSGVAPEFLRHDDNALVVPFKDSKSIYLAVMKILENPQLAERIAQSAKTSIQPFALNMMINKLEVLYYE